MRIDVPCAALQIIQKIGTLDFSELGIMVIDENYEGPKF
jgi:hypothetical protein